MGTEYLTRRRKGYFFKIAVPAALRGQFKSRTGKPLQHIVQGLSTDSLATARTRRDKLLAEWRITFERAGSGAPLTVTEIDAAAREVYIATLERLDAETQRHGIDAGYQIENIWMGLSCFGQKMPSGSFTPTGESVQGFFGDRDGMIDARFDIDNLTRFHGVAEDLAAAMRRAGVTLEPGSPTYLSLGRAIARAKIAAYQGRLRLLRGEPSKAPESFLGAEGIDSRTLQPLKLVRAPYHPQVRTAGLKFSEIAAMARADSQRDAGAALRPSTIEMQAFVHGLFAAHTGDPPLADIDRKTAAGFLERVGKEREIGNSTLNKYRIVLGAVWAWASKTGRHEGSNPFSGLSKRAPQDTGYLAFSDSELGILFAGPMFEKPIADPLAWAMLISLYAGLRVNEIAQLAVADLHKEGGVWVFDVNRDNGKLLKTASAKRLVPTHSALIARGLLDYAARLPIGGRLFPSLTARDIDGKLNRALSWKFIAYRRGLGIDRDRLTFHSLRKNFTTALDRAGVPQVDVSALLGHSRGFTLGTYSSGPGLQRLAELIERLSYEI